MMVFSHMTLEQYLNNHLNMCKIITDADKDRFVVLRAYDGGRALAHILEMF